MTLGQPELYPALKKGLKMCEEVGKQIADGLQESIAAPDPLLTLDSGNNVPECPKPADVIEQTVVSVDSNSSPCVDDKGCVGEQTSRMADGQNPPVVDEKTPQPSDETLMQPQKTLEANSGTQRAKTYTDDGQGIRINSPDKIRLVREKVQLPNLTLNQNAASIHLTLPIDSKPHWTDIREWGRIEKVEDGWSLIPEKPGEWSFWANFDDGSSVRYDIIVNQDPRKLWLVKEPVDRTFEKPHTDTLDREWQDFQVIGASRRGRSHEHSGSFRDDDMGVWADEATGRYVFIVADGAGSAKYSREGARRVIHEVIEKLDANVTLDMWTADGDQLPRDGQIAKKLCGLGWYANGKLKEFVEAENQKHPEDKYELKNFNTTFLIATAKKDSDGSVRLVTFSVGDGAIAWYTEEASGLMCLPDGGEFSGGTRFLTTESVWKKAQGDWSAFCHARVFTRKFTPDEARHLTLFLMTDGVSDPMFETDAGLQNHEKWKHLADVELKGTDKEQAGILDSDDAKTKSEKLLEWLNFWSVGNHDDRTIIAVYPQTKEIKKEENNG